METTIGGYGRRFPLPDALWTLRITDQSRTDWDECRNLDDIGRDWAGSKGYPNVTLDGRQAVVDRPRKVTNHEERNSGVVGAETSTFPAGSPDEESTTFLLRDARWRDCVTELLPETNTYLNASPGKSKDGYSNAFMQQIISAGA